MPQPPVPNAHGTSCPVPNPQRASLHAAADVTPWPPGNALVHCCCMLLLPAACSERIPFVCKPGGCWQCKVRFLSLVTFTFDLWPPKWEKLVADSSWTSMRSFTPLLFSATEKSVTIHTNKQKTIWLDNKSNTYPWLLHLVISLKWNVISSRSSLELY